MPEFHNQRTEFGVELCGFRAVLRRRERQTTDGLFGGGVCDGRAYEIGHRLAARADGQQDEDAIDVALIGGELDRGLALASAGSDLVVELGAGVDQHLEKEKDPSGIRGKGKEDKATSQRGEL